MAALPLPGVSRGTPREGCSSPAPLAGGPLQVPGTSWSLGSTICGAALTALARAWLLNCKCHWLQPQERWLGRANINMGGVCLGRHRGKRLNNRAWAGTFASLRSEVEAADSPGARPFQHLLALRSPAWPRESLQSPANVGATSPCSASQSRATLQQDSILPHSGLQCRGVSQHGLASLLLPFWLKSLIKKNREGRPCQPPSGSWLAVQEPRLFPVWLQPKLAVGRG